MAATKGIAPVLAGFLLLAAASEAQEGERRTVEAAAGTLRVEPVATGLSFPWSLVFLPDGDMLVSEKHPGRLRRVAPDGAVSDPIGGLPDIYAKGNGGLLGLAVDPEFATNQRIFFAFSEPGEGDKAGLSVGRATLAELALSDLGIIFRQTPKVPDERNFGGRLAFAPDDTLYVMTGDRFAQELVQDRSNTIGALVRIDRDGGVPPDNPFVGQQGAAQEVWSWGHRNIEGGAIDPRTGRLWIHEFGPWGGDELNVPEPGSNHGWPLVSWGRQYSGEPIPDPPTRPHLARSAFHWTPVISPSGLVFYEGEAVPAWKGAILIGGLSSNDLVRLVRRGERIVGQERIDFGFRIRDVAQGPDGAVYLLSDQPKGEIFRVTLEETAGQRPLPDLSPD